jgi:hypothetical protein
MRVRFHIDADSGLPHCEMHGIRPEEVLDILRGPSDQGPGKNDTRIAEGQTRHGRLLAGDIYPQRRWFHLRNYSI